jgi:hypothetical protein
LDETLVALRTPLLNHIAYPKRNITIVCYA